MQVQLNFLRREQLSVSTLFQDRINGYEIDRDGAWISREPVQRHS